MGYCSGVAGQLRGINQFVPTTVAGRAVRAKASPAAKGTVPPLIQKVMPSLEKSSASTPSPNALPLGSTTLKVSTSVNVAT